MGLPERTAIGFFAFLDFLHLGRVEAALIWLAAFLVLSIIVSSIISKEVIWNNKHLSLDVIQFHGDTIQINNYRKEKLIPIGDIEEVPILNKDTVLRINFKDKKSVIPEYLADNRKAYESLKDILSPLNPSK